MISSNFRANTSIQTNNLLESVEGESSKAKQIERSVIGVHNVAAALTTPWMPRRQRMSTEPPEPPPNGPCSRCIAEMAMRTHGSDISSSISSSIGASISASTSALLTTPQNNPQEIVRLLDNRSASVNDANCVGQTALHCAALGNHVGALEQLLKIKGIDLNVLEDQGHTPLMLAAATGHHECVVALCADRRCDINIKDPWGNTALMLGRHHPLVVNTLLEQPNVMIDFMTRLKIWRNNLSQVPSTLCCRNVHGRLYQDDAGIMLIPNTREYRDDDSISISSQSPFR